MMRLQMMMMMMMMMNNSDMNTEGAENIDMPAAPEEDYYPIDEEYVDYSDEEYMGD